MIGVALRSLATRRLRTALTAVAVVLGVAMIAGTYALTDQIRVAFDEVSQTATQGIDVTVAPRTAFTGGFGGAEDLDADIADQIEAVPGVRRAEGQLAQPGHLVVDGRSVEPRFAPSFVMSLYTGSFSPLQLLDGRLPQGPGEIAVNREIAEREGLRPGRRVGVSTRSGQQPARIAGIVSWGEASAGGALLIYASLQDVQRWFRLPGRVTEIAVAAEPGVAPAELAQRIDRVLPDRLEVRTGEQTAADTAREANDAMAFLTPALLAFAGAALLVGAFIIYNTFSITVAERTREFALLRAVGATRGQVLRSVAAEALLVGVLASLAGLLAGLGFARVLGALFDGAGFGIPTAGMALAPRTVAVALAVGVGVTLLAATVPALRATRVAPVAAMRGETAAASHRRRRLRAALTALVAVGGVALLAQGLLGGGPATARLSAMGVGTLLVFIGTAMSARHVVRPLAAAAGWPLQRLGRVTGELARENATRNTARTAVTAAALMVGLGLVVFVAVFAASLKSSVTGDMEERLRADLVVASDTINPLPGRLEARLQLAAGAGSTSAQRVDQIQVGGKDVNLLTDVISGIDPALLRGFYVPDWVEGSDELVGRLAEGPNALVEEQFAEQHGVAVGDRFEVTGPTGRRATFTALGIHRDPMILQGILVSAEQFRRVSVTTDPFIVWITADGPRVRERVDAALADFPGTKVRTLDEYREDLVGQLDQIVFLLYALLAMSLVISLFGIANSLFLTIHERTRELGLLRAIGATGRQIRQLIRYESAITAAIGGILGIVVGVVFAALTTRALADLGLGLVLPFGQLGVMLVLAVLVGVLAAVAPARRAARIDVLRAVSAGE
jgi:putative ABC transport system permease protein